jgi:hypothetical protein
VEQPAYSSLDRLLGMIDGQNGHAVRSLYERYSNKNQLAKGSSANHQAWPGGYWDHVTEVLNIAAVQYSWMDACRKLNFSLSDALLVLSVHDLEKLERYLSDGSTRQDLSDKTAKADLRHQMMAEHGIALTTDQQAALKHVEGVRDHEYSSGQRGMTQLGAFVHVCDLISARIWFDHPAVPDTWSGSRRSIS